MKNEDLTLLIMAAGMGSRFGGLKQIEPFGPSGEFLIDYSIYDAIKAGFNKVVFIIKEENYDIFRETVGSRIEGKIKVEYAFQKIEDIPDGYNIPADRVKPLGTAHAILASKNIINEKFIIINADDFYGRDAFMVASEFLRNTDSNTYGIIGYNIKNTLTENGSVKRGICYTENGYLTKFIESKVIEENGVITATPLDGRDSFVCSNNDLVSMNMLCFTETLFPYLEKKFIEFLDKNKDDLSSCECLIPDVIQDGIDDNFCKVKVIPTTAKWEGVTYKEDKEKVVEAIRKLIDSGLYPEDLWK